MGLGLAIESTHGAIMTPRGSHTDQCPENSALFSFAGFLLFFSLFTVSPRSYWEEVLFKKLIGHEGSISIKQLGAETGIEPHDAAAAGPTPNPEPLSFTLSNP